MPTIYFQTHGCSANMSESEGMMGLLAEAGYTIISNEKNADVIVLSVCTVKGEEKMLTAAKHYQDKNLVIAGCVTKKLMTTLQKIHPHISIINTDNFKSIIPAVNHALEKKPFTAIERLQSIKVGLPRVRNNRVIGIIPILNSCRGQCTFCSTKIIKGVLKSFSREKILEECSQAIDDGCKELWLTSQDNACYQLETGKSLLPELIQDIANLPGDFMIRVGMMNPEHAIPILSGLIQVLSHPKVFKFIHLPLQSGSNRVLTVMKREYTVEEFTSLVNTLRTAIPQITIATDIICGFPGESEDEHHDTLELLENLSLEVVNISRYKKREGTLAAMMMQLSGTVIKQRTTELSVVNKRISQERLTEWIGWRGTIIIDEIGKQECVGRNEFYKPVVLEGIYPLGEKVSVRITSADIFHLNGERTLPFIEGTNSNDDTLFCCTTKLNTIVSKFSLEGNSAKFE